MICRNVINRMDGVKSGFTLAEVLITLGIIGVVAALTLPSLIAKYNKQVIVTRLKREYSLFNQAKLLILPQLGGRTFKGDNAEEAESFYKEYYAPYIKSTSIEQYKMGVLVGLSDGSGMVLWSRSEEKEYEDFEYAVFCPKFKDCKEFSLTNSTIEANFDGVKTFLVYAYLGRCPDFLLNITGNTRDNLKELCNTYPGYCITLIAQDGWEIRDDYPFIDKF